MTAPSPYQYGNVQYQSPTDKALSSINRNSYAYKQQGQVVSKLIGDVSFIADNQRKMQKGIDQANENVVQQIQSLVNDVVVLFGGGSPDEVVDLGDLKYVFQGIGALFGLGDGEGGIQLPFNLFDAASHFITQFLFPSMDWEYGFNTGIDNFISIMLNVVDGIHVPFITEAAQEFAVMLSGFRDDILKAIDWLEDLFNRMWKLICALWDYVLGDDLYNGTAVEPFSSPGGDHLAEAWNNLIQLLFPGAPTLTTNKGDLGGYIFDGIFSDWDFSFDIDDLTNWFNDLQDDLDASVNFLRRAINSALQSLHIGYLNSSWSFIFGGTPTASDLISASSGSNGSSSGGIKPGGGSSSHLSANIPMPPSSLTVGWSFDLEWPDYPTGDIFYCVTSVKDGIEGPPCDEVKIFLLGLGGISARAVGNWPAVTGVDGYNFYRRVHDDIFGSVSHRRINTSLITGTSFTDNVKKSGGIIDSPPTKDELDALVINTQVSAVQSAADSAQRTADTSIEAAQSVATTIQAAYNATDPGSLNSQYSDLYNAANRIATTSDSANSLASQAVDILSIRGNNSLYDGMDSNSDATFPLPTIGTLPLITLSSGVEYVDYFRVKETGERNIITWIGQYFDQSAVFDQFYLTVYKIDSFGNLKIVYGSPNLTPPGGPSAINTTASISWNYHILTKTITMQAGELYAISYYIRGGSYKVLGGTTQVPAHPFAVPKSMTSVFTGTISKGSSFTEEVKTPSIAIDTMNLATLVARNIGDLGVIFCDGVNDAKLFLQSAANAQNTSIKSLQDLTTIPVSSVASKMDDFMLGSDGSYYFKAAHNDVVVGRSTSVKDWRWSSFRNPANDGTMWQVASGTKMIGVGVTGDERIICWDNTPVSQLSGGVRLWYFDLDSNNLAFSSVNSIFNQVTKACQGYVGGPMYFWDQANKAIIHINPAVIPDVNPTTFLTPLPPTWVYYPAASSIASGAVINACRSIAVDKNNNIYLSLDVTVGTAKTNAIYYVNFMSLVSGNPTLIQVGPATNLNSSLVASYAFTFDKNSDMVGI